MTIKPIHRQGVVGVSLFDLAGRLSLMWLGHHQRIHSRIRGKPMTKPSKDIAEIPLAVCPLCGTDDLSVQEGKRGLLGKKPDAIRCGNCAALFKIDKVFQYTRYLSFDHVPDPYSFFGNHFQGWVKANAVAHLGELIRSNSPEALAYLSGWRRHLWRVRLIIGATGPASEMRVQFQWETEDQAKRLLAHIGQMQKEIRQVKREMNLDMKEIRAKYGRSKEVAQAKKAALMPYDRLAVTFDNVLVQLDRNKLSLQEWIAEHKQSG